MSDIASRLEAIRDRLLALKEERAQGDSGDGLDAVLRDMNALIRELAPAPEAARTRRRHYGDVVEKCPRCTIRSLHPRTDQVREGRDGSTELLWHCSSCGFELWRTED